VRSLYVSGNRDKMVSKVRALVKNKHEIIFLSDTRLNSTKQIAAMNDLKKPFFAEGYDFYHQSTLSSRGVGILISRKLQYKIKTINGDNQNCNYLLLKLEIGDSHLIVGAIYGPNTDNEINFFENLSDSIRSLNTNSIILCRPVDHNEDCFRMRDIPSKRRSESLRNLSNLYNLTDPYRVFYPNKKEYSYVSAIENNENRSRLDFFIVSDDVMDACVNCMISTTLETRLFDHKRVSLIFKKRRVLHNLQVEKRSLLNAYLKNNVIMGIYETHINHASVGQDFPDELKDVFLGILGDCSVHSANLKQLLSDDANSIYDQAREIEIERLRALIRTELIDLPPISYFKQLPKTCDADIFLEVLLNEMRNRALSTQSDLFKLRTLRFDNLNKRLKILKMDYGVNANTIFEVEREITSLMDIELRDSLRYFKKFEILENEKLTPHFMNLVKKKPDANVTEIKSATGNEFTDSSERGKYIAEFYRDLYDKGADLENNISIADFLEEVNIISKTIRTRKSRFGCGTVCK
jgi:exonuclease III